MKVTKSGEVYIDGKIKNTYLDKDGYRVFKHKGKVYKIHRLVAIKYIPNTENLPTVNHKNGNKLNNHVDNLEWMSFSDNAKHAWANGLTKPNKGESHGRAVLDDMKVLTIRTLPKPSKNGVGKFNSKELASHFGVSVTRIRNIRNNLEWKHLPSADS